MKIDYNKRDLTLTAEDVARVTAMSGGEKQRLFTAVREELQACPFCEKPAKPLWAPQPEGALGANADAKAFFDIYPSSPGHALVVPKRHVASVHELTAEETASLFILVRWVRAQLKQQNPDIAGFNIGINDGEAAGQTVSHLHVHVIPRFEGDMADPRGGVRWVLPATAAYWDRPDA